MADRNDRRAANAPGKFYVDENCIRCGLCWITAPETFASDADRQSFVTRQPATESELESAYEAMSDCPEQAIGDDGE